MITKLYVNDCPIGEFNDVTIQETQLVLHNCQIQNYKLLSWLQSDPNLPHEIDFDVMDSFGKNEYSVSGGRIKTFDADHTNIRKVVIGFNNIVRLDSIR